MKHIRKYNESNFYEDDFCLASPAQPGRYKFTGLVVRLAKKFGRIERSGIGMVVKTWKIILSVMSWKKV